MKAVLLAVCFLVNPGRLVAAGINRSLLLSKYVYRTARVLTQVTPGFHAAKAPLQGCNVDDCCVQRRAILLSMTLAHRFDSIGTT
jgi:hypothetical protein